MVLYRKCICPLNSKRMRKFRNILYQLINYFTGVNEVFVEYVDHESGFGPEKVKVNEINGLLEAFTGTQVQRKEFLASILELTPSPDLFNQALIKYNNLQHVSIMFELFRIEYL